MTVREEIEQEKPIDLEKELKKLEKERKDFEKQMKKQVVDIEKLKKQLEEDKELLQSAMTEVEDEVDVVKLRKETAEIRDRMLRDRAELENYKRRTNDERIKDRKYAQQFILGRLIDMQDNLERALKMDAKSIDKFKEGIILIEQQMVQILETENVTEIEALNKEFDPNFHQAVFTENNADLDDDIVLEVLQKGYLYKDRILRPSMVKVNKKEN